jgi:translation initiation factor IF-3
MNNQKNPTTPPQKETAYTVNEKIRALNVQLITLDGQNVGVVSREDALRFAREVGLDLVLISESGKDGVPVARVMDLGKTLYERKKKQSDAKKHQKVIQIKEIKMRPKIGEHDFQTKIKQMIEFLEEGKRVKITLAFRGRENATKDDLGIELFNRIIESLNNQGFADNVVQEKDESLGKFWSRIYYLKKV